MGHPIMWIQMRCPTCRATRKIDSLDFKLLVSWIDSLYRVFICAASFIMRLYFLSVLESRKVIFSLALFPCLLGISYNSAAGCFLLEGKAPDKS
mmetsp:Transcript_29795/g.45679  ORF Transcript_29795/g.45679 Transcript_29795/m.45679 type:complete len:94 (+) Transcript_29795:64-345(+)